MPADNICLRGLRNRTIICLNTVTSGPWYLNDIWYLIFKLSNVFRRAEILFPTWTQISKNGYQFNLTDVLGTNNGIVIKFFRPYTTKSYTRPSCIYIYICCVALYNYRKYESVNIKHFMCYLWHTLSIFAIIFDDIRWILTHFIPHIYGYTVRNIRISNIACVTVKQ